MTNYYTPRTTVPITPTQSISSVSTRNEDGLIAKTTWEATEGLRRQEEIAKAQAEALAEYERNQLAANPFHQRICSLEQEIKELRSQIKFLQDIFKGHLKEQADAS